MLGGSENDFMSGGDGNDTMNGGSGDDIVDGGGGKDKLFGGGGDDKVRVERATTSSRARGAATASSAAPATTRATAGAGTTAPRASRRALRSRAGSGIRSRSRAALLTAIAVALALAILAPGAAADAPRTQTVTRTVTVGVNPLGTYFDIACPQGYEAVAGSVVPGIPERTAVLGSYKGFGERTWTFKLGLRRTPEETLTLQVQCVSLDLKGANVIGGLPGGTRKLNVTMATGTPVTTATAPGKTTQATVQCPPGHTPASPNVNTGSVASGQVRGQRVVPGGWSFDIYNADFETLIMILSVNCLDRKHRYKMGEGLKVLPAHKVFAETTLRTVAPGAAKFDAGCKRGRALLTGGWLISPEFLAALSVQLAFLNNLMASFTVNNSGKQQASVETVDTCLERKAKLK